MTLAKIAGAKSWDQENSKFRLRTSGPQQCVVVLLLWLTGLRGRGRVAGEPAACRKTVPAKSFEPKIGTAFWDHFRAPSIKALVTGLEKGLKNGP